MPFNGQTQSGGVTPSIRGRKTLVSLPSRVGQRGYRLNLWGAGKTLRRWGLLVGILLILGWGYPAQADSWMPVTPAGLEQQFIDTDSIQRLPGGTVQVRSLYLNQRPSPPERTIYLTEYRCQTQEFRDVEFNGQPGDLTWHPVAGDPLNTQTLTYVCAQAETTQRQPAVGF